MTSTIFSRMDGQLPRGAYSSLLQTSRPWAARQVSLTGEKLVGRGGPCPLLTSQKKRCPRNGESSGIAEAMTVF